MQMCLSFVHVVLIFANFRHYCPAQLHLYINFIIMYSCLRYNPTPDCRRLRRLSAGERPAVEQASATFPSSGGTPPE